MAKTETYPFLWSLLRARQAGIGLCWLVASLIASPAQTLAADCLAGDDALGLERIVEIETRAGPLYGAISLLEKEERFLGPKEVVLTFDDGPSPEVTQSILDTLDAHCTKATFFSVGRMALAYPDTIKDILKRGHTLGGHTWSHPLSLKRISLKKAITQIENGFAALSVASGHAVAPFFRFPGLSDSNPLLEHLQNRGIATFTVDVVSDDSFIRDWRKIVRVTTQRIEEQNGGIVLFHDIKTATAKALPRILRYLKTNGYKVVHIRARRTLEALPSALTLMQERFDKKHNKKITTKALEVPASQTANLIGLRFMAETGVELPVEVLTPQPKARGKPKPETMPLPVRKPIDLRDSK